MTLSDAIGILGLVVSVVAAICAGGWALITHWSTKKKEAQDEKAAAFNASIDALSGTLNKLERMMSDRMGEFHAKLEATSKEYFDKWHAADKQLAVHEERIQGILKQTGEQYQRWANDVEKFWKTTAEEIAPGIFRVRDAFKKKTD